MAPKGRVVGGVEGGAAVDDAPSSRLLDIAQASLVGKRIASCSRACSETSRSGRVVVEDVEAAPEGAESEVVLCALDVDIAHLDGGQPALEADPVGALVDREVESELGAHEQQLGFDVVLHQRVDDLAIRQVAGDRAPRLAAVAADEDVGLEVGLFLVVEGRVDGVVVVDRGLETADVGHLRHAGYLVDRAPVGAAVLGHLDQAVVGADVDQAFDQRRLGERDDVAVVRGRHVLGDRVDALDLAEDRQRVGVDLAAEVGADRGPRVAAIVER